MRDLADNLRGLCSVPIVKPSALSESEKAKAGNLTEGDGDKILAPPQLEEAKALFECCGGVDYYGSYRERTFEEKVREACALLRDAIRTEAYNGLEDDGKTTRRIDYESEDSPWTAVEKLLLKEIYPDKFKPLVGVAKAKLASYQE